MMDRNFITAMILMVAVLFAWQLWFAPKPTPHGEQDLTPTGEQAAQNPTPGAAATPGAMPPASQTPPPAPVMQTPPPAPAAPAAVAPAVAGAAVPPAAPVTPAPPAIEPKEEKIVTPLVRAVLANQMGGSFLDWQLLAYNKTTADKKKPEVEREKVDLVPYKRPYANKRAQPRVFADQPQLVCGLNNMQGLDGAGSWDLVEQAPDHATLRQTAGALTVVKTLRFRPTGEKPLEMPYNVDVEMVIANAAAEAVTVQPFCATYEQVVPDTSSFFYRDYNQMLQVNDIEGSLKAAQINKVKPDLDQAPTFWTGFADNYFAEIVGPDQETIPVQTARAKLRSAGENIMEARLLAEPSAVAPGQTKRVVFKAYLGPKLRDFISAGDNGLKYHFEKSIDFGWFDVIARYLMVALIFLAKVTQNYGVAILILTVIIKVLLFPLQHQSIKSMKAMQKLQPEMAKLREKYKNDKEKLNQEMMTLYRVHKVNPAGGCLPMLIQLPIFVAFYRALGYSIELRHTPFVGWLQDLSAQDPYYITPLLMGVTMFVSQKLTPTSADPSQNRIMQIMPLMFTFMFLSFPAGLVLYWLTNNVLSIAQQVITNKFFFQDQPPISPVQKNGRDSYAKQ
jgi:YidC/Oxa1 family membrane protein insertase